MNIPFGKYQGEPIDVLRNDLRYVSLIIKRMDTSRRLQHPDFYKVLSEKIVEWGISDSGQLMTKEITKCLGGIRRNNDQLSLEDTHGNIIFSPYMALNAKRSKVAEPPKSFEVFTFRNPSSTDLATYRHRQFIVKLFHYITGINLESGLDVWPRVIRHIRCLNNNGLIVYDIRHINQQTIDIYIPHKVTISLSDWYDNIVFSDKMTDKCSFNEQTNTVSPIWNIGTNEQNIDSLIMSIKEPYVTYQDIRAIILGYHVKILGASAEEEAVIINYFEEMKNYHILVPEILITIRRSIPTYHDIYQIRSIGSNIVFVDGSVPGIPISQLKNILSDMHIILITPHDLGLAADGINHEPIIDPSIIQNKDKIFYRDSDDGTLMSIQPKWLFMLMKETFSQHYPNISLVDVSTTNRTNTTVTPIQVGGNDFPIKIEISSSTTPGSVKAYQSPTTQCSPPDLLSGQQNPIVNSHTNYTDQSLNK